MRMQPLSPDPRNGQSTFALTPLSMKRHGRGAGFYFRPGLVRSVGTGSTAGSSGVLDEYYRPAATATASRDDPRIHTIAQAEQRKQTVRTRLLEDLGGLPDYHGALNARVTGQLRNDSYTIEKVIYESLPGFYVTANVYRPNRPREISGVLLQSGHTQEGKPENQRLAANLAMKGLSRCALTPLGRGESTNLQPAIERAPGGWSVPEHIQWRLKRN